MALCWHSLAERLYAVSHAIFCDESCSRVHEGHGCAHEGHACGCAHSEKYDFDWWPDGEIAESWSERAAAGLFNLIATHDCSALSVAEIEKWLEWWWRGENRALRRAMESIHRARCERGRGVLINRVTGQVVNRRCASWRECQYCAWLYGREVQGLFDQVKRLRAMVVFTMPAELGDWANREHIRAQANGKRKLEERLFRRFGRRLSSVWTREHNTKGGGPGRLHLNVLWDQNWIDQPYLSKLARGSGLGEIVDISRIGAHGRHARRSGAARYVTKCLRYASKELSSQADWPKGTRRWGASRAARAQMKRPERNPDWFFSLGEPPSGFVPADPSRFKAKRAPGCLCCLCGGGAGHPTYLGCLACVCGAWTAAGAPRVPLTHIERLERSRASPDPPVATQPD